MIEKKHIANLMLIICIVFIFACTPFYTPHIRIKRRITL